VEDHGHLLRGSAWLLASVGANAFFGFAFWFIATQIDTKTDVGRASALFTAVLFINYATNMGLPVAVARYAPDDGEGSTVLFNWAVLYTGASSLLGTVLFLVFIPDSMSETLLQWGTVPGLVIFFTMVFGMSCAVLIEVRLMALRRWGWVFARVAIVGVLRFGLVLVRPLPDEALWLFLVVVGIPALSGFVGVLVLVARRRSVHPLRPLPDSWRPGLRYSSVNYLGILAVQAPTFALPLIVAVEVSSPRYAAWYVAFSITTVIFLVPHTLGQVLLVEGGKGGADLGRQVRLALGLALGFMAVVAVAGRFGSGIVTTIYGQDYGDAARILPTLVLAGVGWAITSICLTKARVQENVRAIVTISLALAIGILGPALVLVSRDGIDGAARAWLIGNAVAAVTAVIVTMPRTRRGALAAHAAWLDPADGDEASASRALSPG
jgi:O-antigen/teichoic acid export membrane protein